MSDPSGTYELLKLIIDLSTSSLPLDGKLDQILKIVSAAFQPDRCLILKPERIVEGGFLSRLASTKEPLWVDEELSFQGGGILPEEKELLCPSFT